VVPWAVAAGAWFCEVPVVVRVWCSLVAAYGAATPPEGT